jgi:hypothetical protein
MQVAVIAVLCNSLVASQPICREEIVTESDMSIGLGCLIAEAQLDQWKEHSIYSGNQWTVSRVKCVPGAN